jgi:hypothetical protein
LSHATKMPGRVRPACARSTRNCTLPTTTFHGESQFRGTGFFASWWPSRCPTAGSKHDVIKPRAHRGSRDHCRPFDAATPCPRPCSTINQCSARRDVDSPRLKNAPEMFYRCRLLAPADRVLAELIAIARADDAEVRPSETTVVAWPGLARQGHGRHGPRGPQRTTRGQVVCGSEAIAIHTRELSIRPRFRPRACSRFGQFID